MSAAESEFGIGQTSNAATGNQPAVKVKDFVNLFGIMNRLISSVARLAPLKQANLGVADWLILANLSIDNTVETRSLAKTLGIAEQRVEQMIATFAKSGVVTVDEAGSTVLLTPEGKEKIEAVCTEIEAMLGEVLKGREKVLASACLQLALISRISSLKP